MDPMIDFGPATTQLAELVTAVTDGQLALATPCPDYSVGDLLDHIDGLALAFTWAATKSAPTGADAPAASGDAGRLGDDWRTRIPDRLAALADAWRDATAWTGMTQAGPVELPGQVAGLVALDEVVVHGWDLARSTGQAFTPDAAAIDGAAGFVAMFTDDNRGDAFGAAVPIGSDSSALDRLVAGTGRDPSWLPGPPTKR